MVEREWTPASNCFFDAFRNYDEAGYPRRIQCLKCAALPVTPVSLWPTFSGQKSAEYTTKEGSQLGRTGLPCPASHWDGQAGSQAW